MGRAMAVMAAVFLLGSMTWQYTNAASTVVSGRVYCDQCLEGHRTMWWKPLSGATVAVECRNSDGKVTLSQQAKTGILGGYTVKVKGAPAMQGCSVRLVSSPKGSTCNLAGVASKPLSLAWKLFGVSHYTSDAMSYKPAKRMSSCPSSSPKAKPPHPKLSLPPLPFMKPSACDPKYWANPQYKCYWRLISPETKVSVWFGEEAGKRYGSNTTLRQGLNGSGEVYRVLLRESIVASLNSFNSIHFYYNPITVSLHLNEALKGTPKDALHWAVAFRRANSGHGGKVPCLMHPCK